LCVVPLCLPPLRERRNDIPALVSHFIAEAKKRGQKAAGISADALSLMLDYSWPGNVRELQNALHFSLVKSKGKIIQVADMPMELHRAERARPAPGPPRKLAPESVEAALKESGGNKAKAARLLGVSRATLYRFLDDPYVA